MGREKVEEIYERHIKPLSTRDKLRLALMALEEVVGPRGEKAPLHSILELEGLGAEVWEGIEPQEFVNQLREEWDHRP